MHVLITKLVVGCIACVLIVGGITPNTTGAAPLTTTPIAPLDDSYRQMCSATPVPEGWVVTSVLGTNHCYPHLRYSIARIDPNDSYMQMCSATPVPPGWLVTSVLGTNHCYPHLRYSIARM